MAEPTPTQTDPVIDSMRWYHTLELPNGIVTAGEYDLRPVLARLPIPPSLEGKRCIDIGGRDGFYAFDMERRGAAEVVSVDIDDPDDVHFPATLEVAAEAVQEELDDGHRAFEAAREALRSSVKREMVSVYRLDPEVHGRFDYGVIGTLLLHLRDPIRALRAVREVVTGTLLINEPVVVGADAFRRRPIAELHMEGGPFWWICNPAGLRRMTEAAGFRVIDSSRPYLIPYGTGPTNARQQSGSLRDLPRRLVERRGCLHTWVLAE